MHSIFYLRRAVQYGSIMKRSRQSLQPELWSRLQHMHLRACLFDSHPGCCTLGNFASTQQSPLISPDTRCDGPNYIAKAFPAILCTPHSNHLHDLSVTSKAHNFSIANFSCSIDRTNSRKMATVSCSLPTGLATPAWSRSLRVNLGKRLSTQYLDHVELLQGFTCFWQMAAIRFFQCPNVETFF